MTIIIIWILFCMFEGIRDALTFSRGVGHFMKQANIDIHSFLFLYRAFLMIFMVVLGGDYWIGLSLPFLFPFFHEGIYYVARKIIDNPIGYPYTYLGAWFYKSKTTTAKINFGGLWRSIFLLVGIIIIYAGHYWV